MSSSDTMDSKEDFCLNRRYN